MLRVLRSLRDTVIREQRRYAGHSKWANIKHIKAAKDAQRGALFTKLSREMKVAIQEGGSADPTFNLRLAQVVERARRHNMPAANIQATLKRNVGQKSEGKVVLLEIRGPAGSVLLCELFTNSISRVRLQISTAIKKHNVQLSGGGAAMHLFEHKGVLEASPPAGLEPDAVTEHAIECGAEDVQPADSESGVRSHVYRFTCEPLRLQPMQAQLEQLGYTSKEAQVQYLAKTRVHLSEKDLEELAIVVDKLEAQEDVVGVYDNIG